MKYPMHALIVGGQGVGKSTLIRKILEELNVPVWGYVTRKESHLADPELGDPIYIYEAGRSQVQTTENLAGHCRDKRPLVYAEAFERFAPRLEALREAASAPGHGVAKKADHLASGLLLMDEIGIMERHSERFCQAVLDLLDGDIPVLAAVKYKDRPYLNQVRSHPRCRCFEITQENRDELFAEVLQFVRQQLESAAALRGGETKTTIYLIRHNEPDRSVEDDLTRPLTARGWAQVAQITDYLKDKGIGAIYSSDCRRTLDTISGFAGYSGLTVHADARLREGVLGCPKEENPIHTLRQWQDFDYRLPAGESMRQVQQRMCQCIEEILRRHAGQTVVVSTHGTAMCALLNHYQPLFGWEDAREVKRVWPWILRLEFDESGAFLTWEETLR